MADDVRTTTLRGWGKVDGGALQLAQALFGDQLQYAPKFNWQGQPRSSNIEDRRGIPYSGSPPPNPKDYLGKSMPGMPTIEEHQALNDAMLAWKWQGADDNARAAWNQRVANAGPAKKLNGQAAVDPKLYTTEEARAAGYYVPPNVGGMASSGGGQGGTSGLPPEALAFLDAISGPESKGKYNVRFGGSTFDGYDDHPRVGKTITRGPNKGQVSKAAGRYQITEQTWDTIIQPALNLPDFSPESQDAAAWYLAQRDYRKKGGGDLLGTLRSGDPDAIKGIATKLAGTWTSLPSGIEATTTKSKFLNSYNDAFQTRNVAPIPATRTGANNALAAIDSAFAPPIPPGTASAYAPPGGSLQAPQPVSALPPAPRGSAFPLQSRNALPGTPAGRATAIPSQTATPLPPGTAQAPRAPLQATSPAVPTIQAREPWSPLQSAAIVRGTPPKPPRTMEPPSSTFNLAMQLPGYAANYVPTSQRTQAPGLTTRSVQSVPIDPTTGGLAGQPTAADLQTALNRVAAQRAAATNAPPPARTVAANNPAPAPTIRADGVQPGRQITWAGAGAPTIRANDPSTAPTIRANDPAMQPRGRVDNGGINYASAIPTPPTIQAWEEPPPTQTAAIPRVGSAFGTDYPGDSLRLTPQPNNRPLPPVAPIQPPAIPRVPGAILTGANNSGLGAPLPTSLGNWGRRPGVPPAQQTNPTAQQVANDLRINDPIVSTLNGPGPQMLGKMNMGENPLGKFLLSMFLPKEGQVSTARSVLPPTYGLQGGRATPPAASLYRSNGTARQLSQATQRLVQSGGNNAWRAITDPNFSGDAGYDHRRDTGGSH